MQKYSLVGANRETGQKVKGTLRARSEDDARRIASDKGIMVESLQLLAEDPSPATPPAKLQPQTQTLPAPALPRPTPVAKVVRTPYQPFVGEGQDGAIVAKLYSQVESVLTREEELLVLVVQKKPVVNVSPDALAATSRRVIIYRAKMLGRMTMDDFLWKNLSDVRISESFLGATLSFDVVGGARVSLDYLPKQQARMFYQHAQQQEESAALTQREHQLEESRAAAGGVTLNNLTQTGPSGHGNPAVTGPMDRLRELKQMLDGDLISQEEYESKKAQILSDF